MKLHQAHFVRSCSQEYDNYYECSEVPLVKVKNLQDTGSANLLWNIPLKIQYHIDFRLSGTN